MERMAMADVRSLLQLIRAYYAGRGRVSPPAYASPFLDSVRPDLTQSRRHGRTMIEMRGTVTCLAAALEAIGAGAIVVRRHGPVVFATPLARNYLRQYFGRELRDREGRLPTPLRRWMRHGHTVLARSGTAGTLDPFTIERDGKHLLVRLFISGAQPVLVLEERRVTPHHTGLTFPELTRREKEVLTWVVEGKTNADVATILGTRPRTIAKHLEHVYRKIGVENRGAAVSRALQTSGFAWPSAEDGRLSARNL